MPPAPELEKPTEKSATTVATVKPVTAAASRKPLPKEMLKSWKLNRLGCMQSKFETKELAEKNKNVSNSSEKSFLVFSESGSKWQLANCSVGGDVTNCCKFIYNLEATVNELGGLQIRFLGDQPEIHRNGLSIESCTASPIIQTFDYRYEIASGGLNLYGKSSFLSLNELCSEQEMIYIFGEESSPLLKP